jgi:hypothetical protein
MDTDSALIVAVAVVGAIALVGFFWTKAPGFGRFTTSTFLILLSLVLSALFFAAGKFDGQAFSSVVLAIIGFAAGLFTAKQD